jgi:hypothetical protein
MSVIVQPWRRSATTSMNSSCVIICFGPFSGRCLVASTRLKGSCGSQERQELSSTSNFDDRCPRSSLIIFLDFR